MAKVRKQKDVKDYRFDEKRKNNPPAGMVSYEKTGIREPKTRHYAYCLVALISVLMYIPL